MSFVVLFRCGTGLRHTRVRCWWRILLDGGGGRDGICALVLEIVTTLACLFGGVGPDVALSSSSRRWFSLSPYSLGCLPLDTATPGLMR
jgi:hypothetical protein